MTEPLRPKYLLMKTHKNNRKIIITPDTKTLPYHKINSSGQFNKTQIFQIQRVQRYQSEIQSFIWRISTQTKKNHILKIIIDLMKNQMESYQQESKKSLQIQFFQHSKIIKKINYDIDKILQQNNQEVANLVRLKDQISSKRSQRVVFSNLFRKIESQLKKAVQNYQQQIIKSQISRSQENYKIFSKVFDLERLSNGNTVKKNQQDSLSADKFANSCRNSHFGYHFETLYAKKKKLKLQKAESRFVTQCPGYLQNQQMIMQYKSQVIKGKISSFELQIQRILQKTNCKDQYQLDAFVNNVGNENLLLEDQVQAMNKKIEDIEKQQDILLNQKKNTDIIQQNGLPKSRLRLRNYRSGKIISTEQDTIECQSYSNKQIVQSLIEQLQIDMQNEFQRFDDKMIKLDQKVNTIIQFVPNQEVPIECSQVLSIQRNSSTNQRPINPLLNTILQKMQIINQSQKLYQKNWFFYAYQRQLSKFTKKDSRKK